MTIVRAAGAARRHAFAPFDGYPYLVTRIGHSALRHLVVLPADWPRERLVGVAIRQADANRLDTCVCLGPGDVVDVTPGEEPRAGTHLPTGIPVVDRLVIAGPIPETRELAARRTALRAYADANTPDGYIVGDNLQGGRPPTRDDVERLTGPGTGGLPAGLTRCRDCGEARGELLTRFIPRDPASDPCVREVHCRCANHNRCGGCGGPLALHRLSAWYWDDADGQPWYVAAYCALGHRCGDPASYAVGRGGPREVAGPEGGAR